MNGAMLLFDLVALVLADEEIAYDVTRTNCHAWPAQARMLLQQEPRKVATVKDHVSVEVVRTMGEDTRSGAAFSRDANMLHRAVVLLSMTHTRVLGQVGSVKAATYIGITSGVLSLISPDHVCALISLTAACTPRAAFVTGGTWGLAHCLGTVIVCLIFYSLKSSMRINIERYEYIGDYAVGGLLVVCGAYFLCHESKYIISNEDGSVQVDGCACHAVQLEPPVVDDPAASAPIPNSSSYEGAEVNQRTRVSRNQHSFSLPKLYSTAVCTNADCVDLECVPSHLRRSDQSRRLADSGQAGQPQATNSDNHSFSTSMLVLEETRIVGASMMGLLQGLCCPAVVVSLDLFATYVDTHLAFFSFVLSYLITCTFGTASLAAAWVNLMRSGLSGCTPPICMYRTSCFVTMTFGVFWCFGNYFKWLEHLQSHNWSQEQFGTSGSHHH